MGFFVAKAQDHEYPQKTVVDTIIIKKNTLLFSRDSIFFIENDTIIYLQDTIKSKLEELLHDKTSETESRFYDMLRERSDSSSLTQKVLDILTNLETQKDTTAKLTQRKAIKRNGALAYGKVVGKISINKLEVFGPSVNDTTDDVTSGVARFVNRLHMKTRDRVLRNRLLLETGDVIREGDLLDNERLIRSLPYIRDARLITENVRGDTVDLRLISQDLLSYTGSVEPYGFKGGKVGINNINMLGYGHQLFNTAVLRTDRDRKLGYIGRYRIPNIRGSQVEAELRYQNTEYHQSYRMEAERNFLTPNIALAGGVSFEFKRTIHYDPTIDNYRELHDYAREGDVPRHMYKRFSQDYWIARSIATDYIRSLDPRAQLIFAMRYFRKQYYERPLVDADQFMAFHNRELVLFSLGFSKRNYTTEKLVYGYGRTEDIPIGELTQLTFGPEKGEFGNRFFTGLSFVRGKYIKPIGYMSGGVRINGFWSDRRMEDGMVEVSTQNFSYPIHWKNMTFRLFFNTRYARRLNSISQEDFRVNMVSLNDERGIRGLRSYLLYGREKLSFSLETVAYLPFRLYSFRFATFAFADAGLLAADNEALLQSPLYQGYGLGLRIRSDRLAVETFQLRLSCYPSAPAGESFFQVSLAGIPIAQLMDFNLRKPAYYLD